MIEPEGKGRQKFSLIFIGVVEVSVTSTPTMFELDLNH